MARVGITLASLASGASILNVTLNNNLQMPMLALGTWQYDNSTAEAAVKLALEQGFNHIDTAHNYKNQAGVGKALAQFDRSSYFITTKIMGVESASSSYDQTNQFLEEDLSLLGLDSVDLMLLHWPPASCGALQEQWRAMEDFLAAGKARAIGVSNYCVSSFECLFQTAKVVPAVNQIELHVGMGPDPTGLVSYALNKGIVSQAYSPLGNGGLELITGDLVTGIGKGHGMSGAQVSMHWLINHGIPLATKTTKASHMQDDLGIFEVNLEDEEYTTLDSSSSPSGRPSWACTEAADVVV